MSRSVRIGVRLPPCRPVPELAAAARQAEELGFDDVWLPDSQLLWRDVFATATAASLATRSVRIGTAVTNVATRHPSVIASAARTVAEIAPGRFVLGLGIGNSSVAPVGLRPSTRAELRRGIADIRDLLAGRTTGFAGVRSRMRDPAPGVEVHIAATGPANLELAGEIGDGAILLCGASPRLVRAGVERLAAGAERGDRATPPVTVSTFCVVTDDVAAAARTLKPICGGIAQGGGRAALATAGIDVDLPDRLEGVYPDLVHAEDWERAIEVCDPYVSDADALAFAQHFCLVGTPGDIAKRIAELADAGANAVFLQHPGSYSLPGELLTSFGRRVLPLLNGS
ncbi:LLM class flavin-dependent oxidoreductase [Amycolatopsis sp. GM8]|uniref:LLM class flavin-dependent oxidoreductase n=1 Tax=Amycolatopsis sp. GM8 TaxID=2896530 RepID=UPI001F322147|nr:LLM class flavin-dependent oxidoreductase [Amycolatopsis sp. GM8]